MVGVGVPSIIVVTVWVMSAEILQSFFTFQKAISRRCSLGGAIFSDRSATIIIWSIIPLIIKIYFIIAEGSGTIET
jgi:hypothetical protein